MFYPFLYTFIYLMSLPLPFVVTFKSCHILTLRRTIEKLEELIKALRVVPMKKEVGMYWMGAAAQSGSEARIVEYIDTDLCVADDTKDTSAKEKVVHLFWITVPVASLQFYIPIWYSMWKPFSVFRIKTNYLASWRNDLLVWLTQYRTHRNYIIFNR